MKFKYLYPCLLLMGVWLAAPGLASADEFSGGTTFYGVPHRLSPTPSEGGEKSRDTKDFDLAPSADIPSSVDGGHSRPQNPWWDRRPSADPGVQDLRGMDGGGFAPPGSYTGSMRRP